MSAGIMELSNSLIYGNKLRCGSLEIANAKLKFSGREPVHLKLKQVTILFLKFPWFLNLENSMAYLSHNSAASFFLTPLSNF